MKALDRRIARLEKETLPSGQSSTDEILQKWIESHKKPIAKTEITPEERKRFDSLLELSNSMSNENDLKET